MLLRVLLVLALGYVVVCGLVWAGQRKLLYFPGPAPRGEPQSPGPVPRRVTLRTDDGEQLGAWWFEAPAEPEGGAVVLVSHGNAGSVAERLPLATSFMALGASVLLYDYRGYGASSGTPSEAGLYRDGRAAWAWLRAEGIPAGRVVLYGESLGAGVAVQLAGEVEAAGLILESAFTSVPDLAAELYPWLPARWLVRDRFDNRAKLGGLGLPILLLHSRGDEVVPFAHGERLLAAAPPGTRRHETTGGHNDGGFQRREADRSVVQAFLARVTSQR